MTLSFVFVTSIFAILFPDITAVLSLLGGICSVTTSHTIPSKYSSLITFSLLLH